MLEALASGRSDDQWVSAARPWVIVAWLFLSAGIVLGAQWAYVELSYGGYWNWDPVEIASLLPWLTSTALLHSMMVQRQRRMFRFWTAGLTAGSFIMCVFGAYLMRGGVIESQHAFPKSPIGQFFLVLLAALVLVSVGLIFWRRDLLKSAQKVEAILGKEGLFLTTMILLVVMTAILLVGTIFPILSQTAAGRMITVKAEFYNTVVAPMGLAVLALMAVGPMLGYGKEAAGRLPRRILLPGIVAAVAVASTFVAVYRMGVWQMHPLITHVADPLHPGVSHVAVDLTNEWTLACTAIIALALTAVIEDLIRATILRARDQGEPTPLALVRLFDRGHRRYGGQLVHIGMLMILAGVAGSSLFGQKHTLEVNEGQSVSAGGYTLHLEHVRQVEVGTPSKNAGEPDQPYYTAITADVTWTDSSGRTLNLHPEVRRFHNRIWRDQPHHEVSLSTTLTRDIYMTLAGLEQTGDTLTATFEVLVNPLVLWIWIGGGVLVLGGILCLVPPLLPASRTAMLSASNAMQQPRAAGLSGTPGSPGSPGPLASGNAAQITRTKSGKRKSNKGLQPASLRPQVQR
jgi:cytochrome c-type biogenesis protein CcmF